MIEPTPHSDLHLEFTVEPFVEHRPGPHVLAAIDAARVDQDLDVEVGPFGTSVRGERDAVLKAANEALARAFANGATRVILQVSTD